MGVHEKVSHFVNDELISTNCVKIRIGCAYVDCVTPVDALLASGTPLLFYLSVKLIIAVSLLNEE